MADVKRTVEILFQGNDKVSQTLLGVQKGFGQFDLAVQSVAAPLARVTDVVLGLDAVLAAMAVGGMALAIHKSGEFETSFQEISTLVTSAGADMGAFKDELLDYATKSTKSLGDITAATYSAISAGIDHERSIGALTEAEKLSVAGKADLEASLRLVAGTLNAYGGGIDEAARYSNAFFKTVQLGQTTIPELASSLSRVTGIAASAGVPIEDLSAAVAALTAGNISTAESMTGLKTIIGSIIAPSAEAKAIFEKLHIEYGTGAIEAKGLNGVLTDMYVKTGGNAEQLKKLMGGIEGYNAGIVLASDRSGKYAQALEAMRNGQDVVTDAFNKMKDTINNINQTLKNNVDILLVQVGDRLMGGYKDVAGGITDIFQAIQDSVKDGAFDGLFAAYDEFARKLGDFLREVAVALPEALAMVDFSGIVDAIKALSGEFGKMFDGVDLATPDGLAKALQFVVDGITALINVTNGIVQYFSPMFDALAEAVDRFSQTGDSAAINFGKVLAAAKLVTEAGLAVAAAIVLIKETGADMSRVFDTIIGSIKVVWNTMQVAFDTVMQVVTEFLHLLLTVVRPIAVVIDLFGTDLTSGIDSARDSLRSFRDTIRENQFKNMQELGEGAAQAWRGISGAVDGATESTRAANAAWAMMAKGAKDGTEVVKISARDYVDAFKRTGDATKALEQATDIVTISARDYADALKLTGSETAALKLAMGGVTISARDYVDAFKRTGDATKALEQATDTVKISARDYVEALGKVGDKSAALLASIKTGVKDTREEVAKPWNQDDATADFLDFLNTPENFAASLKVGIDQDSANEALTFFEHAFPDEKAMAIAPTVDEAAAKYVATILSTQLPETKTVQVIAGADSDSLQLTDQTIADGLPGDLVTGKATFFKSLNLGVKPVADDDALKNTKEYLLKEMETMAETMQTRIEWDAKVDMAEWEAATKTFEASIGSVNLGIQETTKLITAALEGMDSSNFNTRWAARETLDQELDLRAKEFEIQEKLANESVKLMEAKRKALESGKALITVNADGLTHHLQMLFEEIIKEVQILANEEASPMLLGI